MRLGIFGGTFDPVHYGHLLLAECCREQCELDQIWLLPAGVPPHKQQRPLTPANQRVEMLRLAVGGHEAMAVSTLEIERGGVSYTVDTLATIGQQRADAQLFLLMGADTLYDLPTWRQPEQICQLAIPLLLRRPGVAEPDFSAITDLVNSQRLEEIRRYQVQTPLVELSGTDIRHRVSKGMSIRYRTPRAVEKYIETHGLYGSGGFAQV